MGTRPPGAQEEQLKYQSFTDRSFGVDLANSRLSVLVRVFGTLVGNRESGAERSLGSEMDRRLNETPTRFSSRAAAFSVLENKRFAGVDHVGEEHRHVQGES